MNGIFAVDKPSGVSSSHVVLQLQQIFTHSGVFAKDLADFKNKVNQELASGTRWLASKIANRVNKTKIKVGHGGTLDPLALGILVIGVGSGTKKLQYYLSECVKTYEARALLGQSTTTGDSEGEVVVETEAEFVTLEDLKKGAFKFVGKSKQTPPVFSALKVDGMPLYEYAKKGIPLPRPIKPRVIEVHLFTIHDDFEHSTKFRPRPLLDMTMDVFNNQTLNDHDVYFAEEFLSNPNYTAEEKSTKFTPKLLDPSLSLPETLPCFHLTASVGSGTYIRSLINDLGRAVCSSAHMVELIRTRQSDWVLGRNVFALSDFTSRDERVWGPVLKSVFEKGPSIDIDSEFNRVEQVVLPMISKHEAKQIGEEERDDKVEFKETDHSVQEKRQSKKENFTSSYGKEHDAKRQKTELQETSKG